MKKFLVTLLLVSLVLVSSSFSLAEPVEFPEEVTAFQTEFFRVMELNNVIITSKETVERTSDAEPPITSFDCEPYKGQSITVNFCEGELLSFTTSVDTSIDYAYDKFPEAGIAFLMAATESDKDTAYSVFEYLLGNLVEDRLLGQTSELVRETYSAKFIITPFNSIIMGVYPIQAS